LWLNDHQEGRIEREKKRKILNLIMSELTPNVQFLETWQADRATEMDVGTLCLKIHDEVWQAFSDGGELEWIKDPYLVHGMAEAYARIRSVKLLSEKALDIVTYRKSSTAQAYQAITRQLAMYVDLAKEGIIVATQLIVRALAEETLPWWRRLMLA